VATHIGRSCGCATKAEKSPPGEKSWSKRSSAQQLEIRYRELINLGSPVPCHPVRSRNGKSFEKVSGSHRRALSVKATDGRQHWQDVGRTGNLTKLRRGYPPRTKRLSRDNPFVRLPSAPARGNDLILLAGIHASEGTDGRRFVRLHVVDSRLELDLPRFHPLKRLDNPV